MAISYWLYFALVQIFCLCLKWFNFLNPSAPHRCERLRANEVPISQREEGRLVQENPCQMPFEEGQIENPIWGLPFPFSFSYQKYRVGFTQAEVIQCILEPSHLKLALYSVFLMTIPHQELGSEIASWWRWWSTHADNYKVNGSFPSVTQGKYAWVYSAWP